MKLSHILTSAALLCAAAACESVTVDVLRPEIPPTTVCLTDFGAIGDGLCLCSDAFESAMEELSSKGGGHLVVPAGVWLTGPIRFRDNIDLHLEANALIVFSDDRDLYPIVETVFEGLDTRRCLAPLNGTGLKNISITGSGTIDGNGDSWRQVKKFKMTSSQWKSLVASGGFVDGNVWYPDSTSWRGAKVSDAFNVPQGLQSDEEWESVKTYLRPCLLEFTKCDRVLLQGVLFQNSPCWNLHPLMCTNLTVENVSVRNPWYCQNGDGIDIDSCDRILVDACTFDVGDDAICVKSGKDEQGRRRGVPCTNLTVRNCTVFHGHGGFVVGSEMSGGVRNVNVSDCTFLGTDVGLRFKSCRGRGGVVENISISNIFMKDIATEALLFDLHYGGKSAVEAAEDGTDGAFIRYVPADETTPAFRNISINGIVCDGADRAMYFNGLPEMPVENVSVSSCRITSRKGVEIRYARNVSISDADIRVCEGEPFVQYETENLSISE